MTRLVRQGAMLVSILGVALASGCTLNAALEVKLTLPAAPAGGPMWALTQPRRAAENPFPDEWRGSDLEPIELLPGETIEDNFSVLSDDEETDLHIKVRFCVEPACDAFMDDSAPEVWFLLRHPFYIGKRTRWEATIPTIPTTTSSCIADPTPTGCPIEVAKCAIIGCVEGGLATYCSDDGRHICER